MARSMTGFGTGQAPTAGSLISVELRSVNHRFLDLRMNLPAELAAIALDAEQWLRSKLKRGRVDATCRIQSSRSAAGIDRARARAAFLALRELRDELAPGTELPLGVLAAIPDLFRPPAVAERDELFATFAAAADMAVVALHQMRAIEGIALARHIRTELTNARNSCAVITREGPLGVEAHRERLRERISRLLAGVVVGDAAIDAGRLEVEVVVAADRCDVSEELARLACHFDQLDELLGIDDAVGKKLDFLLQEMVREANTIGSKSQSVAIAREVVELRTAIDRMREQAQNIE
jgi:uncharacterized protein (TIGR00255 family)